MYRILIVEDDRAIRTGLQEKLNREGFTVEQAEDGDEALRRFQLQAPDLIILDLMLPKRDGFSVLREVRKTAPDLPVLILSARGEEQQKVEGLKAGADDYLAKPFGLEELMARIEALLRRVRGTGRLIHMGSVVIDTGTRRVTRDGQELPLSRKELELLLFLAQHPQQVLPRERILSSVWGGLDVSDERSVDYHILNLRKKVEADPRNPRHIITRHGLGYQLQL